MITRNQNDQNSLAEGKRRFTLLFERLTLEFWVWESIESAAKLLNLSRDELHLVMKTALDSALNSK